MQPRENTATAAPKAREGEVKCVLQKSNHLPHRYDDCDDDTDDDYHYHVVPSTSYSLHLLFCCQSTSTLPYWQWSRKERKQLSFHHHLAIHPFMIKLKQQKSWRLHIALCYFTGKWLLSVIIRCGSWIAERAEQCFFPWASAPSSFRAVYCGGIYVQKKNECICSIL